MINIIDSEGEMVSEVGEKSAAAYLIQYSYLGNLVDSSMGWIINFQFKGG